MKQFLTPAKGAFAAAFLLGAGGIAQAQLRPALETGERATRKAEQIQEQINQLDDRRNELVREFRTILQRTDAAKLFAAQQARVVESQTREIESLTDQLGRVDEITSQMIPMMLDMIEDLENFVAADLPFLADLRSERISQLKAAMDDPQVPAPEAYRLIIEAYQAEMEYGSTINTYKGTLDIGGSDVTVDFLQYGRVSFVYVTPNGQAARWNRDTGAWEDLPGRFVEEIRDAIRIVEGKKQQEIMTVPVSKFVVE